MKRIPKDILEGKIIDEVLSMSFTGGVAAVSTKKMAANIGISEPAIFAHYSTKQDLMNASFVYAWNRLTKDSYVASFDGGYLDPSFMEILADEDARQLSFEKEIYFSSNYIQSRYFDPELFLKTSLNIRKPLGAIIKRSYPNVDDKILGLVVSAHIDMRLKFLYNVIHNIVPDDEDTWHVYHLFLISGVKGVLESQGK